MSLEQIFSLAASAAFLGLAALALIRGRPSVDALTRGTAALCVDLLGYNGLELYGSIAATARYEWLERGCATVAAPLLFHLTLAFLGERRQARAVGLTTTVYFATVCAACLAAFVTRTPPGGLESAVWAGAMLAGLLPAFGYAGRRLTLHYRASGSADERARTQLFAGTVAVGVGGPIVDLSAIAGDTQAPPFAAIGMLLSALLLTALAIRARVLSGSAALLMGNALVIGALGAAAQLLLFRGLGSSVALLGLGSMVVTLVLLAAARWTFRNFTDMRERTAHLAMLGRLSAQMAHDIRNPLAAIHGAAQYLEEERRRGSSLEDAAEFLALIVEQSERLERVIADYRRLGRAEPARESVSVAALLDGVVGRARASGAKASGLATSAGEFALDPELLRTALENLVRNAHEADPEAPIELTAERLSRRGVEVLAIAVRDEGPGMDPRTREQAEEAFFTTKAQGSGLGLAFARQVAEAHGGELRIESALGRGTTVTLELSPA